MLAIRLMRPMEQLPRLASGVDRSPQPYAFAPRSNEPRRRAKSPAGDRDLACGAWVNVLVVGAEDEVAEFITSLWPCLAMPIAVRDRGEPLRLSPAPEPAETLVIHGVETLTRREQLALKEWLNAGNGRARVVSSASASLFSMVESGVFDDGLYYRLNVVLIDLTSPTSDHP